jgi:DNA-binding NarL/FixJ family response regulator
MRVLIADRHILFREGLERLLSTEPDFEVVGQASRLGETVEQALRLAPDLVLLDVELADGSGLDALRQIMARRPQSTVVVFTNRDTDEYLFEAFRAGARGYLIKDTPFASLLTALRRLRQGEPVLSRAMTSRIVQEFYRSGRMAAPDGPALESLTARELQVLRHLARGASNREIADRIVISEHTVKVHVRHILEKLELKNRSQAANAARRAGLVPGPGGQRG